MTSTARIAADRLAGAEAARREGNPLALYDLALEAIKAGDPAPRLRYLQVLALAQIGDTARADALYEQYGLGSLPEDEDAVALRGRIYKDFGRSASGAAGKFWFDRASRAYLDAYAVKLGYFPLINAATTSRAAGDSVQARALASRVLAHPDLNPARTFFACASRAEALMLLDRPREAAESLATVLATRAVGHGERAAAYRQIEWLCAHGDIGEDDCRPVLVALRLPPVLTYTGHMFRAGGQAEAAIAARVGAALDDLGSLIAYGALACGADIVVAEAILRRGGELHVIMPFLTDHFIESSVRPGGEGWVGRFHACRRQATSITFATRMDYVEHDGQFTYGAQLAAGIAQLRAGQLATRAVQLAVWDGRPAAGSSGAAVDVATGRAMGLETQLIDPGQIDREMTRPDRDTALAGARHSTRAILFTDYQGYSRLPESKIPVFVRDVMGRIAAVLDRNDAAVCSRNTWGDALYAVVSDPEQAADIALDIIDALADVRLAPKDDDPEGMRIGLHVGPVYQAVDPVTGRDNFYGSEVTLTARIEPRAACGQIYTTQAFAAILAVTAPHRFATRYVGRVELAKGYGVAPIYQLERRTGDIAQGDV